MKDRIVEHPNRYQMVPVAGTTDTFDLLPVPGAITESGTAYNKANLLNDETAELLNLTEEEATPNNAIFSLQRNKGSKVGTFQLVMSRAFLRGGI